MIREASVKAATSLSVAVSRSAYWQMLSTLDTPDEAQARTLRDIVRGLSRSDYGRRYGLTARADYEEFAARIPITSYDALSQEVARIKSGEPDVLWPGRPVLWRKTSGSSGAAKDVPIAAVMRRVWTRFFLAWCHDVMIKSYRPRWGKFFMSISPVTDQNSDLLDDATYLGGPVGWLLRQFLIAPGLLTRCRSPETFRLFLGAVLLAEPELEIISIWNPSYLLVLLDSIQKEREKLRAAFCRGQLEQDGLRFDLPTLDAMRDRALSENDWQRVWPELRFISCWSDAAAKIPAAELVRRLPHVALQSKGLLSTESPVSLPLVGVDDPLIYSDGVFVEFVDDLDRVHRLQDVNVGQEYRIIVSPLGGFVRYDLADRVRITGFHRETPTLRFVGREGATSDLVGEKLHESFVRQALQAVLGPRPACLLPALTGPPPYHYVLVAEGADGAMAAAVDQALHEALRYGEARRSGQLAPIVPQDVPNLRLALTKALEAEGLRWGDIKDCALLPYPSCAAHVVS